MPLHLQVSSVSPTALKLVEAARGSVERVYYTRLGLRALLKVSGSRCCVTEMQMSVCSRRFAGAVFLQVFCIGGGLLQPKLQYSGKQLRMFTLLRQFAGSSTTA